MSRNIPERADEYMRRIQRICNEHMDMLEKMMDDASVDEDEIVRDMVLAEYNFDQLAQLYELDSAAFVETVEKTMTMEDIDVWLDILMREPAK
jgi:hypothetical protein